MKRTKSILFVIVLAMALTSPAYSQETAKEPIDDIADIIAWKSIQGAVVSRDGQWFA